MSKLAFLYVTNSSEAEAKKLAKYLLEKRMIGCANIYSINAMYWWKGEIADDKEWVLIAKTPAERVEEVRKEIIRIHPFETPCVLKIDVDPNEKYLEWIRSELG